MVLNQRSALRLLAVALAAAVWCVLRSTAQARKIRIAPTGSTSVIQTAVDEAAPGDTILVSPGTYYGPTVSVKTNGTPPGCVEELFDDLQLLPSGSGILNVGGHDVIIRGNVVVNNDTAGVGVVENPFGVGSSNDTVVTRNVIVQNGKSPDPRTQGSGDIVYLDNPANGSCISGNVFKTSFIPFGSPPACQGWLRGML